MNRRQFLRSSAAGALGVSGMAAKGGRALAQPAADGPYGPLGPPDANGIQLPAGFTARELARFEQPVGASGYRWPVFPDGGATFATDDGWIYVSNSEHPGAGLGGVGALRFDAAGEVVDGYSILTGTAYNCAGGTTPWGTWLSCEEKSDGQVWECDPTGETEARVLPALGVFEHEAVAVDPVGEQLYLTEDVSDGRFYRFTPSSYPSLDAGALEVAVVAGDGTVTWVAVPDPSAASDPTRDQVTASTAFNGGEGIWYEGGHVYFTTKGDTKVWDYEPGTSRLTVLYDGAAAPAPVLGAVDNVMATPAGEVFVCEDGDNFEIVVLTREGVVAPFLRVLDQPETELAGPAISPDGRHFYFSSQRGAGGGGITYDVTGPLHAAARDAADEPRQPPGERAGGSSDDGGGSAVPAVAIGGGTGLVLAGAGAVWWMRTRRTREAG